ncbi:hypothetical protein [Bacillus weihaiensis]|uniref:Uncharacterized protein n=1 Tax=Bacillus weihaiensis TaxID=1547283 RepID=A0A1L3MRI6_9BACI|nr:hypothetical protein [Bacillus weihaiensis]APH04969.1 hypothetical protein A9C19_09525 [Bacillus weihaiensis]
MGFLRDVGKFAGKATGTVIGGAVNVVGDVTGSKFIQDVGDGVKKASEFAGDTVGQVADGAWNTASGLIQEDKHKKDQGINDVAESIGRTAKGVYQTAKATYNSGKSTYEGYREGDDNKVRQGLRDIGKTVAVGAIAVGVVDLIDGADDSDTVTDHQHMAGGGTDGETNAEHHPSHELQAEEPSTHPGTHHVEPHYVDGHWRDGVWIDGYWRDGDGDTSINLSEEEGGGYFRADADENSTTHLKS